MKIEINEDFKEKYLIFLQSLSKENEFEYYPPSEGLTRDGENISLGFSCFALKSFHILNEWENLSENKKQDNRCSSTTDNALSFIKSTPNKSSHSPNE